MAHDEPSKSAPQTKLVIRNIGLLLSGDLTNAILDADTVVAVGDRIAAVGKEKEVDTAGATVTIDAKGTALAPGLIDSHVHPVCGDWTPRQNQIGWIDSYLHGGVTTMISAGEVHTPGKSWSSHRSEEHTSELQSHLNIVCRLLLEKKKKKI